MRCRFSQPNTFGSARFQGMAGVNTALGADVSSIAGNPAGLGFFRKSEWSISAGLNFAAARADYLPFLDGYRHADPGQQDQFQHSQPGNCLCFA
jgi:hypothetical protein